MNPERMNSNRLRIFTALNKISGDAAQWKRNKLAEMRALTRRVVDGVTMEAALDDWLSFRRDFLKDWDEVDPSGGAYTKLLNLQQRATMKGKKQMSLPTYAAKFKELIAKAKITGDAAFHMFGKGLTPAEFEKAMLMNPTTLDEWYRAAITLDNIRTRTYAYSPRSGNGHASSSSSHDEWAMQVDNLSLQTEIAIRAMSSKERERHIKEGLCFICGNKGHMSGECPKRKTKYKGKGRFKGGKKKRSAHDRHIRATSNDDDDNSGTEEVHDSSPDYTQNIRAMMKGMSTDERTDLLLSLAEEKDF